MLLGHAATALGADPAPVPLKDGWRFTKDPDRVGLLQGWQAGRGAPAWREVSVPHVIDPQPEPATFRGGVSWYRLEFTGPTAPAGWGWGIRFGQVRKFSRVWLNGREIGRSDQAYTPFTLPASGLRPGQRNALVVRVDSYRRPGFREGWWNWGGITREVHLEPLGPVHIRALGVMSDVSCSSTCSAFALVDGWVVNRTSRRVRPSVALRLSPPDGDGDGEVSTATVRVRSIRPGEAARVRMRVPVRGTPQLWWPESPRFYDAVVEARVGDRVMERRAQRVGLRSVRVRDGALWLNGRQLELRGASIQEDLPGRGPALTDADVERIVTELKAVNANVTRAHYLLNEKLLRRLDEEGILVWSQAPVYHRDVQLRSPLGRERELEAVRQTVLEARKHPSVLTHSVANELSPRPDDTFTTRSWLESAAAVTRELDPTVPVSLDVLSWPDYPRQSVYDRFDLLGVNSYFGWYPGRPDRRTGNLADLEPFLRDMRQMYPKHALVMTEFGAESTYHGPRGVKETFAFQSDYLERNLDIIRRNRFMGGAIYWTLQEFAVKPRWDGGAQREGVPRDSIHNKALITYDGKRKPAWSVAARDFAATPLYRSPDPVRAAAARAAPPEAAVQPAGVAGVGALLLLLLALAWFMLRAGIDIWRASGVRAAEAQRAAERRERMRLVA